MKHKKAIAVVLSLCMFGTMLPVNVSHTEAASVKLKKIKLNESFKVIKKGGKVKLKATFNPKKAKATVTWKSSNKKVATVSKSGVVKGKKKGKATITAKANGKKATCKIQVGVPVKSIKVAQKTISLKAGQTVSAGASVQPKNASVKKIAYVSSNTKVATVTSSGVIRGVAAGTAQIQLTSKDGNNKKQTIVVNVSGGTAQNPSGPNAPSVSQTNTPGGNATSDPQNTGGGSTGNATPSPDVSGDTTSNPDETPSLGGPDATPTPTPRPDQIVHVTDESDFDSAVSDDDVREIHVKTTEEVYLNVPDGDYSYLTIYLNAPNAELDIEGKIAKLYVENNYPTVRTWRKLTVENSAKFRFVLMRGGESSDVLSSKSGVSPDVYGLGRIRQTYVDTQKETLVTALAADEYLNQTTVSVSGGICDAQTGAALSGAKISLISYTGEYEVGSTLTAAQLQQIEKAADVTLTTDDKGIYAGSSLNDTVWQGNYFAVVTKDGYETSTGLMCISSQYGNDVYVAGVMYLVPEKAANGSGSIKGSVIRNTDMDAAEQDLIVTLRQGSDNVEGESVQSTVTGADGSYQFTKVPYGTYTISVSSEDMAGNYAISWDNITVADSSQSLDLYANERLKNNQWRFEASWSKELENANLHLTGAGLSGTEYHVWQGDDAIYESGYPTMKFHSNTKKAPKVEAISVNPVSGEYAVTVCAINETNSTDTDALAWSGMQVKAYQGDMLTAVYNVPLIDGNVWNVLTYDSYDETFACYGDLDELESETELFADYDKSYRAQLKDLKSDYEDYSKLLSKTYTALATRIKNIEQLLDTDKLPAAQRDEEYFGEIYNEQSDWYEDLQDAFSIDIGGDYVEDMDFRWNSNKITVYTNKPGVTVDELEIDIDGVSIVNTKGESGALTAYQVTLQDGQSRLFQIYLKTLLEYVTPLQAKTGIAGLLDNVPFTADDVYRADYGVIYMYPENSLFTPDDVKSGGVQIDFGDIGDYDIIYEVDSATGSMFVVIDPNGEEPKKWEMIPVSMPVITAKSGTEFYWTDYEEDKRMTIYCSALPNNNGYDLKPGPGYNAWSAWDQVSTDDDEIQYRGTMTSTSGNPAKTVEVVFATAESCAEIDDLYLLDKNGDEERFNWEIDETYRELVRVTMDKGQNPQDYDWLNQLVVEFEDERVYVDDMKIQGANSSNPIVSFNAKIYAGGQRRTLKSYNINISVEQ